MRRKEIEAQLNTAVAAMQARYNITQQAAKAELERQCHRRAAFMSNVHPVFIMLLFFLFWFSIVAVQLLRVVTPGVRDSPKLAPNAATIESTAIPETNSSVGDQERGEDHPPPYQPPTLEAPSAPAPTPAPAKPSSSTKARTSAERFIIGTSLLAILLFTVITIAFGIQGLVNCQTDSVLGVKSQIFFWFFYCLYLLWASVGVGCWLILLRNLWGPKVARRYPIKETALCIFVFGAVGMLTWGPFWCLWKGSVWFIEQCQGRLCGDALEEEAEESVELEEGQKLVGGNSEDAETSTRGAGILDRAVPAQTSTGLSKADL